MRSPATTVAPAVSALIPAIVPAIWVAVALFATAPCDGKATEAPYASNASRVLGTHSPAAGRHSPEAMAGAALHLISLLDEELRGRLTQELKTPARRDWTNLPARRDAGGVRLGDLDDAQLAAAYDLLATLFSEQGYRKLRNIMLADDQLLRGGRPRAGFGTENFAIEIFGTPSTTEPWAFQIDGHHVGVNLAMRGDAITMSPSFIGTQPAAFTIGDEKIRPLAGEIDDAFALATSLNDEQRTAALVGAQRGRIRTGPGTDGQVPKTLGVSCAAFSDAQKAMLMTVIGHWVNDLPGAQAKKRMTQLASEIDRMHFAWSGPTAADSDVSYAIQGPTLVIEYACQDLGGNPLEHLHTMYRDPTNEYGGQMDD